MILFGCLLCLGVLAIRFGVWCLLAWITQLVAAGFGCPASLPFWPLVGAWFLVSVLLRALRGGE